MVETAELESATPCMSSKYSNQLSYASITLLLYHIQRKNAILFEIIFIFLIMSFLLVGGDHWSSVTNGLNLMNGRAMHAPTNMHKHLLYFLHIINNA